MLKLLHPFMPFLTEELWQALHNSDEHSIMVASFPEIDEARDDQASVEEMEMLMEMITSVRNIRGEMRIPPSRKLKALISAADEQAKKAIEAGADYIVNLANLESMEVGVNLEEPPKVATGVVGQVRIYVPLAGIVDISEEKARLEKEMGKVGKDLEQSSRKLANHDFRAKAAPEVIAKEEGKLKSFQEKFTALETALKKLGGIHD